jgi:hypoxanthine phosphoribosyltransferase
LQKSALSTPPSCDRFSGQGILIINDIKDTGRMMRFRQISLLSVFSATAAIGTAV